MRKIVKVVRIAYVIDGKVRTRNGVITLIPNELYECGHFAGTKTDIYGEYYAKRRRCDQCLKPRKHDPTFFAVIWDDEAAKKYPTEERG